MGDKSVVMLLQMISAMRTHVYSLAIGTWLNFNTRSRNHVRLVIHRCKIKLVPLLSNALPFLEFE